MESVIDQLRVQDGKIFQNEKTLTLYVDIKRLILDNVLLAISANSLDIMNTWTPELENHLIQSLTCREPEKLLNDIVHDHAKLLYDNPRPLQYVKIGTLMKGFCQRILLDPSVKNKDIMTLDPIKQDFVCREAYRRTLASDCMLFEPVPEPVPEPEPEPVPAPVQRPPTPIPEEVPLFVDIRPEDSISQISQAESKVTRLTAKRPVNVRKVVLEDEKTVYTRY
jgi:hypothetical protein